MRENYESINRQRALQGKPPVKDEKSRDIDVPNSREYVLKLFFSLNRSRKFLATGMGDTISMPLSDSDLLDYQALYHEHLMLWEIEMLRKLDSVYLTEIRKKKSGTGGEQ